MDILMDLLLFLVKTLITHTIGWLFSRIPSEKSKKKTTRKTRQSGWLSKKD